MSNSSCLFAFLKRETVPAATVAGTVLFFLLAVPAARCFAQGDGDAKPFKSFSVYQDKNTLNRYTPSGYMPTGECVKIDEAWTKDCKEGKSCLKIIYDVGCSAQSRRWAGVYWLNPADNWGDRKGGYNLTGAKKLTFWARGEKGGEVITEFKFGGVGVNRAFPDSDTGGIGPVILSKDWREYTIDLRNKDLTYISGGFAWITSVQDNPEASTCTFFLDDIRFE